MPAWLPKTQLYYGLERFGLDGAAGVIEARIQAQGGEPHVESVADRAARVIGGRPTFRKRRSSSAGTKKVCATLDLQPIG